MANQYVNKVIIGKEVKLDLTADSVTPDKLAKGITAHDKTGAPITGTNTKRCLGSCFQGLQKGQRFVGGAE